MRLTTEHEQTLRLQRRELPAPAIPTPHPPPARNWYVVTLQAWKETGIYCYTTVVYHCFSF